MWRSADRCLGSQFLVATRLGLFASNDEGDKWAANPGGMPASTVNSVVYGSGTLAFAVQYGKLWESERRRQLLVAAL